MERANQTCSVSEFTLLGLSSQPENQKPLFALFFVMYMVTMVGNFLIILAIHSDTQLQTPMYFFLSILSLLMFATQQPSFPSCWWTFCQRRSPSPMLSVWPRCISSLLLPTQKFTSWQPWPLTAVWPSVTPSTMSLPWATALVSYWWPSPAPCLTSIPLTGSPDKSSSLSWLQYYPPHPLWHQPSAEIILLLYICQWNCN